MQPPYNHDPNQGLHYPQGVHRQPAGTETQFPLYQPYQPYPVPQPVYGGFDAQQQADLNRRFEDLGSGVKTIMMDLQRIEAARREQMLRDERTGTVDYDMQA